VDSGTDETTGRAEAGSLDRAAGLTRRVRRLDRQRAESHRLARLDADPHLAVVRLERQRQALTRSMWFFLGLGLGFTTTGVQAFLAGDRPRSDPVWWGAWLIEPALAGILITLLIFEASILSRGLPVGAASVRRLKGVLLAATLFMNVWPTLRPARGEAVNLGMVFAHLVIPVVVFLLAEVMPVIQERFTAAITAARDTATLAIPGQPVPGSATGPAVTVSPAEAEGRPVPTTTLRLPPTMREALSAKATEVAAQGRTLTAQDVQAAVKVPAEFATKLARELSITNGHTLTD
jgi:cytochrome c biogenesis protein CcdA